MDGTYFDWLSVRVNGDRNFGGHSRDWALGFLCALWGLVNGFVFLVSDLPTGRAGAKRDGLSVRGGEVSSRAIALVERVEVLVAVGFGFALDAIVELYCVVKGNGVGGHARVSCESCDRDLRRVHVRVLVYRESTRGQDPPNRDNTMSPSPSRRKSIAVTHQESKSRPAHKRRPHSITPGDSVLKQLSPASRARRSLVSLVLSPTDTS
jgi:hypothetical protein